VASLLLGALGSSAVGQARSAASRRADLQVGAEFAVVKSDYDPQKLKGFGAYSTLDLNNHFGLEFDFRQGNSGSGDSLYERTYEVGPRYFRTYGPVSPYVKAMYGRGVFNFPGGVANLAYNLFAGGAGVDFHVLSYLNLRADYEYQRWLGFPPTGLTPQAFSVGVAYHFPGGLRTGRHF
jgi:opacity protein-like surface antigen